MDRVRAGLTGLAAVFLVTAAASLLFAPDAADTVAAEKQEPGEPLAQLGVAPGSDKAAEPEMPPEPAVPPLEARPSGGLPAPGDSEVPAHPSPVQSGGAADPGRPVAI